MRLYIDIDGVLLIPKNDNNQDAPPLKEHVDEFIKWAVYRYDCYWLTAWAPDGTMDTIKSELLPYLPKEANAIKPSKWHDLKTEALDPAGGWIWIDDNILPGEQRFLEMYGLQNNFIKVDPYDPSMRNTMRRIFAAEKIAK
ncbi:MAG: hypothetical protein QXU32_01955 [Nitrososphaerales archaeon]